MGIPIGMAWAGYGDRNSVPTAALPVSLSIVSYNMHTVVKVDRRIRWHYTSLLLYFAFTLVHDSRGIEIVNFTISLALSAATLMASAGTPPSAGPLLPLHAWFPSGYSSIAGTIGT